MLISIGGGDCQLHLNGISGELNNSSRTTEACSGVSGGIHLNSKGIKSLATGVFDDFPFVR